MTVKQVGDVVPCFNKSQEYHGEGTVIARIASIIGYVYMVENEQQCWLATGIYVRPDDPSMTLASMVSYGAGSLAKTRELALCILKDDMPIDEDPDETPE